MPALRKAIDGLEQLIIQKLPPISPSINQRDVNIPIRDGKTIPCILIHPVAEATPKDGCPVVILWHGGGFTLCTPLQVVSKARGLAQLFGCAVLCPNYRKAPEHPFPTGVLDAWDSVLFASKGENFQQYGVKVNHSKGFITGGWSAGANFSAVLSQKAKDERLSPPLTGQYLGWLGLFLEERCVPEPYRHLFLSKTQNADDPTQTWEDIMNLMNGAKVDADSPLFNPCNVPGESTVKHAGLPKAFIQTSGWDAIRDDALIYARVLKDAGVETLTMCYPGLPHASELMYPEMQISQQQAGDCARGFAWMMGIPDGDWDEGRASELMKNYPFA